MRWLLILLLALPVATAYHNSDTLVAGKFTRFGRTPRDCHWERGYGTVCYQNGAHPHQREFRVGDMLVKDLATSITPWWNAPRGRSIRSFVGNFSSFSDRRQP